MLKGARRVLTFALGFLGAWVTLYPVTGDRWRVCALLAFVALTGGLLTVEWLAERNSEIAQQARDIAARADRLSDKRQLSTIVRDATARSAARKTRARELSRELYEFLRMRDAGAPRFDGTQLPIVSREETNRMFEEGIAASRAYHNETNHQFNVRFARRISAVVAEFEAVGITDIDINLRTLALHGIKFASHERYAILIGQLAERDDSIMLREMPAEPTTGAPPS
jgi:hypothetical protein